VGGKENITVDVRIIAASNRDLEGEVRGGRFRPDLFYRLNILALNLPPLRERISDIPALAHHLLAKHGEKGIPPVRKIAKEAMRLMMRYPWPGNIRELSSVIERAVVLAEGGEIGPAELPPELREETEGKSQIRAARPPGQSRNKSEEEKGGAGISLIADLPPGGIDFEKLEESLLRRSVERSGGIHTRGADLLKMSYKTYMYRLKKFGIVPP
jgi:DNA-binding NtrC family response regulator